jgi:hypothetical protein
MPVMNEHDRQSSEAEDHRSKPHWAAYKKMDAVLRLLPGEPLDQLSGELAVEAHRLASWRDDLLEHCR